jgi:XTP/dITP diphosphohydrolase
MRKLVLATRNRDKVRELRSLLSDTNIELATLDEHPAIREIVEDQPTLEGNALKKAREVFRCTGLPTLADDSGLEVHYLNQEPGAHSSRYAGVSATYTDNCAKLLMNLRGVPGRRRAARFRCVLAFVAPNGLEKVVEGVCMGSITEYPRGSNGFGYDPIFVPNGYTQTLAEMPLELKNKLSHRSKAIQNIKSTLMNIGAT